MKKQDVTGGEPMHSREAVTLEIDYLIDHPKLIRLVARWKYRQWSHLYPRSLISLPFPWIIPGDWVNGLRSWLGKGTIPTTWIAFCAAKPAGVVSLADRDDSMYARENETRKHLSPWLAGLYVDPEFRRRGVAKALIECVVGGARSLQVPRLYLQTFDLAGFYERLGWESVGRTTFQGREVVLMGRETAQRTAT
jgi:GNAT superfamily N-acetyltransferase